MRRTNALAIYALMFLGAYFLIDMGRNLDDMYNRARQHPLPMQTASQTPAADSECGYACPLTRAALVCDVDGSWVAWLMPGQSVRVPIGRCTREDLPTVFDSMGEVISADVHVVGE